MLPLFAAFVHAGDLPRLTPGTWRGTLTSPRSVTLVAVTLTSAGDNALSVQVGGLSGRFLLTQEGNNVTFNAIPVNLTETDGRWTAAGVAGDTIYRLSFLSPDDVAALTLVHGGDARTYTLEPDKRAGLRALALKHGPLAVLAAVFAGAQLLLHLARTTRAPVKEKTD
jgi:hypothetical protein